MPRPVVPILRLPRSFSLSRSIVLWYGMIRCVSGAIFSRVPILTPRAISFSTSARKASGSSTMPPPRKQRFFACRMPEGIRCSTNFSPPTMMVWPALLPPA